MAHKPQPSVCLFTDTFLPDVGGAELVLHNLASRLSERGRRPVVVAPRPRTAKPLDAMPALAAATAQPYPISHYRRPFSKRWGVRLVLPRLIRLHRRYRFGVLHCHAAYPQAYVASTLKRLFGIPYVVRPHGSDILPGERIRSNPRLERRTVRGLADADVVIAQGEFLKEVVVKLGVDERRVRVIHNGVDLQEFATAAAFSHPRPYMLALGNLLRRKGMDVLIRAYARLEAPPADLLIAGTGPELDNLRQLATDTGVADRVRFVGFISGAQKLSLYRSAVFFVCPSRREPFANVILEALAAGLPVIATAVGGNRQLVRDGHHGLLCPPEDDEALAVAMQSLLASPERLESYRQAVPDFIAPFNWERIADQYASLYDEVAQAA